MRTSKKYKRFLIIILFILSSFAIYIQLVNRNSINMTYRQKFLKAVYPAFMWFTKLVGSNTQKLSNTNAAPAVSFYSLKDTLNNGAAFDFAQLKGKKVLLVNTASDCGYTDQYTDLQKLYEAYKDSLIVIGFPANDFKEQEKGDDATIAAFCQKNYGVSFLLMQKSSVVKTTHQNAIFKWLTDAAQNGWNSQAPSWNFSKYLVNENGVLINYFGPSVSPLSGEIQLAIKQPKK
jgi:glutathione peroxidase